MRCLGMLVAFGNLIPSGLWCHTHGGPSGPESFRKFPWVSDLGTGSAMPSLQQSPGRRRAAIEKADPGAKLSGFKASLAPQGEV